MSKLSYTLAMLALSGVGAASQASANITETLNIPAPDPTNITATSTFFDLTPITLAGKGAPQFYFGFEYIPCSGTCTGNGSKYVAFDVLFTASSLSQITDFGTDGNGNTIVNPYAGSAYSNSSIGTKSLTPGIPSHSETFTKTAAATGLYANPKTYTPDGGSPIDISNINGLGYAVQQKTGQSDYYIHVMFDPAGTTYRGTVHVDGAGGLTTVTYNAVPEPEAWALLIAGTAMAGGAMRSRRRKAALTA